MPQLILFANNYWNTPFQVGSHFLAKEFANDGWEVLYISDPIGIAHFIKSNIKAINEPRFKEISPKIDECGVVYWAPFTLATCSSQKIFDNRFLANNWHKLCIPQIKSQICKLGFNQPDAILINSLHYHWAVTEFNSKLKIFRIADLNTEMSGMPRSLSTKEKKIISSASHVFASSKALIKDHLNPEEQTKTKYLPNGFSIKDLSKDVVRPIEYTNDSTKKIAVYVGAIDSRFDIELITKSALQHPNTIFYCVGKNTLKKQNINSPKNLVFLGPRPFSKISQYIKYADICLMPQTREYKATDYFNPLKMYQYMALGKPVLSTWWKELDELKPPIRIARTTSEFIEQLGIDFAADENSYEEFLKNKTWTDTYRTLKRLVFEGKQA